ncbi:sigma-54 interaction domain-containing protein [Rhodoferax antarcticus]|uniref:sigma-54 interaction domain-containing protein n=1 Tax=Rhodoferax antarcticus TaxID=81479 RepID=UPI0022255968|nr:sigma 54-interacting transcriptional regulator [Rhodoferax antarcticus]MCW2311428.1 transcriptional regulator with PAS, ATPase and Fis domain [Rhodoferax antarcticus]
MKILLAWIGNSDMRAVKPEKPGDKSPILEAMKVFTYDAVHLISTFSKSETDEYIQWAKRNTEIDISVHAARLTSPTNHEEIYRAATQVIKSVQKESPDAALTFHLSPGTPAMAAIWLLLAKTHYPAKLIESSREQGVNEVNFPFELSAEFMPATSRSVGDSLTRLMQGLPPESPAFSDIVHQCAAMKRTIAMAHRLALTNVSVLIQGESGTGKELFARAIHRASTRSANKFVAVNCGAIPESLVDSELFGHQKGAFTGAASDRKGYFEAADGGTLFLDEIGELPLASQVRLLRVLQESEVTRVGATTPIKINVRIIAATHRALPERIQSGLFREDLYYRIAVGVLMLPPLREREGDLTLLIESSLKTINSETITHENKEYKKISVGAKNILLNHSWPGNVRELHNTLVRACIWMTGDTISAEDVREALTVSAVKKGDSVLDLPMKQPINLEEIMSKVARHYLTRAMAQTHANKTEAATLLGLGSYQTLSNWLKRYEIK